MSLLGRGLGSLILRFSLLWNLLSFFSSFDWCEYSELGLVLKRVVQSFCFPRLQEEMVMLTLLSLTSVLVHNRCILWVSGKQCTFRKIIYLASNLFHEMLSLWLYINIYHCTLSYLRQCLKIIMGK